MKKSLFVAVSFLVGAAYQSSYAQFGIAPLTSFGAGGAASGWLENGEIPALANDNNQRGLAFGNGKLYLVSRTGGTAVRRLDPLTGADLGSPLSISGVSGGTFLLNAIAVAGDGVIYSANLTTSSSTSPFKVYRWASEAVTPTVAYSGDPIGGAGRFGDNLAAYGGGSFTRLIAGAGNTALLNDNSFALIDPTVNTAANIAVAGAAQGDFRLGITFTTVGNILGTQGSAVGNGIRYTDQSGTLLGTSSASTASQRPLGYTLLGGIGLLAAVDTVDGIVRIYDASNPAILGSPVLFGVAPPFAHNANSNGSGAIAWGNPYYDVDSRWKANLYVLESNNGIQAYVVAVPEPSTAALAALAFGLLGGRALRRRQRT